jgi:hypothetical protein
MDNEGKSVYERISDEVMTENNIEKMTRLIRRLDDVDEKYGRKVAKKDVGISTEKNDIRALITLFDAFDQDKTIGEIKSTLVSFLTLIK